MNVMTGEIKREAKLTAAERAAKAPDGLPLWAPLGRVDLERITDPVIRARILRAIERRERRATRRLAKHRGGSNA